MLHLIPKRSQMLSKVYRLVMKRGLKYLIFLKVIHFYIFLWLTTSVWPNAIDTRPAISKISKSHVNPTETYPWKKTGLNALSYIQFNNQFNRI